MIHQALAVTLLTMLTFGCTEEQLQRFIPGSVPNVKGTWVGRLEQVKVYNFEGQEFNAAALQIESGPAPKEDYPGELKAYSGEGSAPILATWDHDYVVAEPSTLPIAHRVKVNGVLFVYTLTHLSGGPVSRKMPLGFERGGHEQILYVRGSVKALD